MPGIKINNLEQVEGIISTDDFIVSRNQTTKKIKGETFFNNFSGVKNAENYGDGVSVYKGSTNATDGTVGTTLQFNTLSGTQGIKIDTASSLIVVRLEDGNIDEAKYKPLSISENKLQNNSISTAKLQNGSVTPEKQSNTLCNIQTKTNTQSWLKQTIFPITGLSAVITPPTTNAKVLLTGTLSIGAANCAILLRKTVGGVHTYLARGNDTGDNIYETTFAVTRNSGDFNPAPIGINYIDSPNTTSQVTYSIILNNTDTKFTAYVNRGVNETNVNTCFRTISQFSAIVLP
jgi:hypothetical protein